MPGGLDEWQDGQEDGGEGPELCGVVPDMPSFAWRPSRHLVETPSRRAGEGSLATVKVGRAVDGRVAVPEQGFGREVDSGPRWAGRCRAWLSLSLGGLAEQAEQVGAAEPEGLLGRSRLTT